MGMMLTYRKGYWPNAEDEAPEVEETPEPSANPYAELTDEQVLEAYVTTFPEGEATERDAQVVELRAAAAFAHTFDTDPEDGSGE